MYVCVWGVCILCVSVCGGLYVWVCVRGVFMCVVFLCGGCV